MQPTLHDKLIFCYLLIYLHNALYAE